MVSPEESVPPLDTEASNTDKLRVMGPGSTKFSSVSLEGMISGITPASWKDLYVSFLLRIQPYTVAYDLMTTLP